MKARSQVEQGADSYAAAGQKNLFVRKRLGKRVAQGSDQVETATLREGSQSLGSLAPDLVEGKGKASTEKGEGQWPSEKSSLSGL
ncbi:hypothetical protein TRIP_E310016 [uncultured Spirochaetota bacterium]|uniref:Uncharacterized protein n=1 Tax=uncultured Spirochaetota bacterium TaxID=460511 RepID=A0A652ZXW8_9SPIR|nr:hypothetical protein TRIP_E310016 [uncultured Spirochaetota bacterium]